MASKDKYVVLTRNNARILTNYNLTRGYNEKAVIVKNPDLSKVKGLPPHYWKVRGEEIVPMTRPEKMKRRALIAVSGVGNNVERLLYPPRDNNLKYVVGVLLLLLGAASLYITNI